MALKVIDKGWNAFIETNRRKVDNSFTKVGFPENLTVAKPTIKGSGKKPITDPATLIEVAAFQEWGTKWIESAPFMFQSFQLAKPKLKIMAETLYKRITAGTMTTERALGLMGEYLINVAKAKITEGPWPKLSPKTEKAKGSTKRLIDRGQMRNSITQKVEVR